MAINASGLDHNPVSPKRIEFSASNSDRTFQPCNGDRARRDLRGDERHCRGYQSYTGLAPSAARRHFKRRLRRPLTTRSWHFFPSRRRVFDALLTADLPSFLTNRPKANVLTSVIERPWRSDLRRQRRLAACRTPRRNRFHHQQPTGKWRQDPISELPLALGAF